MKVLDLFSGIGGFSLGLERAGFETVAFCEYDKAAQKVLKLRWPNVPIYPDIRELTGYEISADVITGGYPCQPFSVAGKRAGATDDRHLWPEMYRIIKAIRPRWIVAENVAGHVSMGLDDVLSDLEAAKYTCWPFVIPACAVDARHRRDRVWIVANSRGAGRREGLLRVGRNHEQTFEKRRTVKPSESGEASASMADAGSQGLEGQREVPSRTGTQQHDASDYSRWPTEPAVGRVANGIPHRVDRLKQLGNSVVPQIPEIIGRAIMNAERNQAAA